MVKAHKGHYSQGYEMRRGVVGAINPAMWMVSVLTEDDGFTIIELLSEDDFETGDVLAWGDDYGMGHTNYRNVTKDFVTEVYVQNHGVPLSHLRQQLLI